MTENPLADDPQREARIRTRAYFLWLSAGKPDGRDQEFWERACELVAMEENPQAGRIPVTAPDGTGPEAAELEANLGEFPSRLTDQGDRPSTPAPQPRAHNDRGRRVA
jgi:hypothetical protein